MTYKKGSDSSSIFTCECCDYSTCRKSQYDRHLLTAKHKILTNTSEKVPKSSKSYECDCGKAYKHRQSLNNHKKHCNYKKADVTTGEPMIEYLLKENIEMKKMFVDICKKIEPASNNIVNNNNVFNINVFLNEQCKDAMNITEFMESIQLNLQDMMKIADNGQTKGMSNILIDKLNSMDVLKRPLHCSDLGKETIYIKDQDKWEKEGNDKPRMKNVLNELTKKTISAMNYMEDDPDVYVKTISEIIKDPREDKKIISNIAKEISILE